MSVARAEHDHADVRITGFRAQQLAAGAKSNCRQSELITLSRHRMNGVAVSGLALPLPHRFSERVRDKLTSTIEAQIDIYRRMLAGDQQIETPAMVRKKFERLRIHLAPAIEAASGLSRASRTELARRAGRDPLMGMPDPLDHKLPPGLARGEFLVQFALNYLQCLRDWTTKTLEQLPEVKKGRPAEDKRTWLCGQVVCAYELTTGEHCDRTKKGSRTALDLIRAVLKVADPTYKQTPHGTEKLLRSAITKAHSWKALKAPKT